MRLVQYKTKDGARRVAISDDSQKLRVLSGVTHVYDLAREAIASGKPLATLASARAGTETDDYETVVREKRLLPPLDHPDPYRCLVTGTGLSHLGSAAARDSMHTKLQQDETSLTDSMKMFKWGIEGGKPATGNIGTPPEWFYKGDARWVVPPEGAIELPAYAQDGGEEVETVGLYIIDEQGSPWRVGVCLGNEYSDHVTERQNYLYLAHSKLRQSSYGPELLLGEPPTNVKGHARLLRAGNVIWESEWLSGEDNMCHSLANLEHHHFKYREFRRPGDVHVHYFGAATGSFTKNIKTAIGDVFEIAADGFGRPLRNTLGESREAYPRINVRSL